LDDLTIALSLCIGSTVAWVFALYGDDGLRQLLWNVPLGVVGAGASALALSWTERSLLAVGLFTVVPLASVATIWFGNLVRDALRNKRGGLRPPRR
jgi:hypothetical protein